MRILAAQMGGPPTVFSVTINSPDPRASVTYTAGPGEFSVVVAPALLPLETAILQVATDTPQPAKVLARLTRRPLNSHFYAALRGLTAKNLPLLIRVRGGYRLP
jgi:hypothetical protein